MSPMILTSSAPAEAMTNRNKERKATARARIYIVDVLHTLLSTTGLTVSLSNPHPISEMASHHYIMKYAQRAHACWTLPRHGTRSASGVRYGVRRLPQSSENGGLRSVCRSAEIASRDVRPSRR